MVSLGYEQVKRVTAVLVILPVIVFAVGFLKPLFAVIGAPACLISLRFVLRRRGTLSDRGGALSFTRGELAALLAVMLLWGYLGGMNGFFYQSSDWNIRNAVYRDLLSRRWPVVYPEKMTALVYYIGYWLVPAALAKPFYWFFGAGVGWTAARMLLWIWTSVLTLLVALNLMIYVKADTRRKRIVCLIGLIGFSGMDVLGALITGRLGAVAAADTLHLEWWSLNRGYQFSSMTTCLYWVFNQTVLTWLTVMCVLFEEDPRSYMFWGLACMLCGPLPFVGLVILMLTKAGAYVVKRAKAGAWRQALAAVFSPSNLLMLAGVFPFLATYFLANNATAAGAAGGGAGVQGSAITALLENIRGYLSGFLVVFVMDAGVYLCLLLKKHWRDPLYWAAALSLAILPYFRLGASLDFAMRTTVPGVFLLMVFCVQDAMEAMDRWRESRSGEKLRWAGLLAVFLIGLATPAMEVFRGVYNVVSSGTVMLEDDSVPSIADIETSINFEASMFTDKFFFNTLAKRPRTDTAALYFSDGFYPAFPLAQSAAESSFRLVDGRGELVVYNGYGRSVAGRLQLVFGISEDLAEPYTVTLACGERTYAYEITAEGQTVTVPVTVDGTALKVYVSADKTGEDGSPAYFSVSGVRLYDGQGNLLAGEQPRHPELESEAAAAGA